MKRTSQPRAGFVGPATETRVSKRLYVTILASGVAASIAQLIVIPIFLDARSFGLVIAGIAATQGSVLLADLGCIAMATNVLTPSGDRSGLREAAYAIAFFVVIIGSAIIAIASIGSIEPSEYLCIVAGLLTGPPLMFSRLNSNAHELAGDERGALISGLRWQNAPKVGMVVGAMTGSAEAALWGGLISSVLICGIGLPKPAFLTMWAQRWRLSTLSLALALSPYLMSWGDSFALGLSSGLADLGAYGFVYRLIFAVSYIYGPLLSVVAARSRRSPHDGLQGIKYLAGVCLVTVPPICVVAELLQSRFLETSTSWVAVVFLGLAASALAMSSVVGRLIIQWGDSRNAAAASTAAAAAVVITSVALVPHWGVTGAALGSLVGMLVAFLWQLAAFFRLLQQHEHQRPTESS